MSEFKTDLSQGDLSEARSPESGPRDTRDSHGGPIAEPPAPNSVVTECDLPQGPEKVWRALTVPDLLAKWLPEAVQSEIVEAEPNRLLRYRWNGGERDKDAAGRPVESVVSFELTRTDDGGTHLRVVHRAVVEVVATSVRAEMRSNAMTAVPAPTCLVASTVSDATSGVEQDVPAKGRIVCLMPRIRGRARPARTREVAMIRVQIPIRRAA